ncbi:hypothetical protein [Sphingobacterium griseoflavum]|uniref:Uncharacterized protein n=1 Tax=Sphingobacterium griseoflavum TaxID=1474952 RepID=A0ABQ3HZZ2_9SPHI|nr:hypothetical protein [Sphingobacterium griseoflavum]GHE37140.1 hypothetical protein GCM10017764_20450 [Sphingobacterium griseoflavum]
MRCKKDDYVYYDLQGLEGKKIDISLTPTNLSYKVGELISITGTMLPQDIGLDDFKSLEDPSLSDFRFYDQNNLPNIDYDAFGLVGVKTGFNSDKTAYNIKYTYVIKKSGLYKIMNDPSFSSQNIYSLIYISVLTGKRKPKGYRGYVPLIFTNNDKTFIDIEVVE